MKNDGGMINQRYFGHSLIDNQIGKPGHLAWLYTVVLVVANHQIWSGILGQGGCLALYPIEQEGCSWSRQHLSERCDWRKMGNSEESEENWL